MNTGDARLNEALGRIERPRSVVNQMLRAVLLLGGGLALLMAFNSLPFALKKFDFHVIERYQTCSVQPDSVCLPDAWGGRHAHWMTRYRVRNAGSVDIADISFNEADISPGNDVKKTSFGFTYLVNGRPKVWAYGYWGFVAGGCAVGLMLLWYWVRRRKVRPADVH